MTQPAPGTEFLRALAAAALREGDPAELAERAAAALAAVFRSRKSLVLDVQFTGFLFGGKPLGGVDPSLLRAAGQLIVQRLNRVGFTPDASAADLEAFFRALADPGEGVLASMAAAQPHGIYLASTTGVYRPPARARRPAEESAEQRPPVDAAAAAEAGEPSAAPAGETSVPRGGEAPAAPVPVFDALEGDGADLSEFELLDDFPALGAPASRAPTGLAVDLRTDEVASNDMFHFFRTADLDARAMEVERLPGLLQAAVNPARFDEITEAATRAVQRLLRTEHHAQAVEVLDALVHEAERPDRTRIFRESAQQALGRVGTPEALHALQGLLENGGEERERILHFFAFMGGEAAQLLEALLLRTAEPELRAAVFRHLLRVEGGVDRIMTRALSDASPARARLMLEMAVLPEVPGELAVRWLSQAATHADVAVRTDVVRLATAVGGRGGLRVLLDLLGDRDPAVKRAAAQALGVLGDTGAVPFLARLVGEGGDEELQVAAIGALGRLRSGEALPALLGVVNRRSGLFGAKKLSRPKSAAIAAIARLPTPAAREVIESLAGGKDAEVAAEAQRVLATID